jgi:2-oxoglutarate ferredoxin oxidoreductase subunit gamma
LIDDELVSPAADRRADIILHGIPATRIAGDLGNARAANTVMLGFWSAIVGVVSPAAMRQSLSDSVPSKTVALNLRAFDTGFERGLAALNLKSEPVASSAAGGGR